MYNILPLTFTYLRCFPPGFPVYVSKVLCSEGSMFRRFYSSKVLCPEGSVFRRFYVPKVLCSEGSMFRIPISPTIHSVKLNLTSNVLTSDLIQ